MVSGLNKSSLHAIIDRFEDTPILVVGDMAIDEMVYGQVDRLSREAPVMILQHRKTDIILGAAANAAHNLASLQASTKVAGVLGDDFNATQLLNAMRLAKLEMTGMVCDKNRPTTTKSRISGTVSQSVTQQMVRIDRESREPLSPAMEAQIIDYLRSTLPTVRGLLLSDYGLGVLTPAIRQAAIQLAHQAGVPVAVDSQGTLSAYAGATIVTPNQPEAEKNLGSLLGHTDKEVMASGRELLQKAGTKHLLITRGQDGMALFEASGSVTMIPVFNRSDVFDVTGAGDTVVATLLLAIAVGATLTEAAILGNLAASIVVRHFGCATTTPKALQEALNALPESLLASIQPVSAVVSSIKGSIG